MLKHKHSDVGVAVAMPGGLITPIIRKAETKTLSPSPRDEGFRRARPRGQAEAGGIPGRHHRVSNLGMYGIKSLHRRHQPAAGPDPRGRRLEERPVVTGGKIEIAQMMSVTLSCDHRAIDGALGAELIGALQAADRKPVMMMV
jgi:pyruvate dehydrogenase E2 component (dihydrolipoamide acetyltransferase)